MFTGIVEEVGRISELKKVSEQAIQLSIVAKRIMTDMQIGDSVAVNGICLTVTAFSEDSFQVDVMPETMKATSLKQLTIGSAINLERAMPADGRFGGHFVTGHVDHIGEIVGKKAIENAIYYDIKMPDESMKLCIDKGSIAVDGVSLTIFAVQDVEQTITLSLIPHTVSETILGEKEIGDIVNMECDVLAKLVHKQTLGGN